MELSHPRRAHASLWAGPDVTYLRRRSQAIPDPIGLYDYEPADGQPLSAFPEVFPEAWAPTKTELARSLDASVEGGMK